MSAIFDHIIAIVVGAVLVGALLFVQMRRQESAVEATVRNRVEWHADEFLSVVQRDAENMRTAKQARHAFGEDRFTIRRRQGADGAWYTAQVSFPTLADPAAGVASPLAIVSYEMKPTGEKVRVGTSNRPTYAITRYEYRRGGTMRETGGAVGVLEFNAILVRRDGTEEGGTRDSTRRSDTNGVAQVKVSVMAAAPLGRRAADQATTTMQNAVRRATTVRVTSASADGGDPPLESGLPGVPPFPLDPPPPPPLPPSAPTAPPTAPTPTAPSTTTQTSGSGSPPPAPPPPKTPPPPPPGRDI